jgi:hypothetical protein
MIVDGEARPVKLCGAVDQVFDVAGTMIRRDMIIIASSASLVLFL